MQHMHMPLKGIFGSVFKFHSDNITVNPIFKFGFPRGTSFVNHLVGSGYYEHVVAQHFPPKRSKFIVEAVIVSAYSIGYVKGKGWTNFHGFTHCISAAKGIGDS